MTLFSPPVHLPWERDTATTATFPDVHGAAAQIADGIALVAWGESVLVWFSQSNWYYQGILHLAAVRHTDAGPVLGPTFLITPPFSGTARVDAIISDPDGGAWVFTQNKVQTPASASTQYKIGRFTVDPATLVLSVTWLPTTQTTTQYGRPWFVDIWPEQRVFVAALEGGPTAGGMASNSIYLISMDTGAIIAHRALPLGSGATPTRPKAFSFHPERQEVLLIGDRVTGGWDRPTLWTAPITATTIGAFVLRTSITTVRNSSNGPIEPVPNDDLNIERGVAIPRPGGQWEFIAGTYVGFEVEARHFLFTPGTALVELDVANPGGEWVYSNQFSHSGDMVYDAFLDRAVIGLSEVTDREPTVEGVGLGGVRHLEFDATTHAPLQDSYLPDSWKAMNASGTTLALAPVGAGRFIYLFGASALSNPWSNRHASYQFVVYAAGQTIVEPVVPGIKGEAPEENRCAFRELKH